MKKLLLIEWMVIRKYRTFWVLFALFALTTFGVNLIVSKLQHTVSTQTQGNIQFDLFQSPYLWNTTGWLTSFTLILPCLLIIVLITNEYSYKTLRQRIINGITRTEIIISKWLLIGLLSLACWLIYFLITWRVGNIGDYSGPLFSGFYYAGYVFLKILLSLSLAFIFSIWLKKSGSTIALFLVYYFLGEGIIGHFLNNVLPNIGDFLPLSCGTALVSNPFKQFLHLNTVSPPANLWFVLLGIGWIILFIFLSFLYIRRADL